MSSFFFLLFPAVPLSCHLSPSYFLRKGDGEAEPWEKKVAAIIVVAAAAYQVAYATWEVGLPPRHGLSCRHEGNALPTAGASYSCCSYPPPSASSTLLDWSPAWRASSP
jgi:hypothetical protein